MKKNIEKKISYLLNGEHFSGKELIMALKEHSLLNSCYSQQLFGKDAITLEEHTLKVIETYELYFEDKVTLVLKKPYFKLLLAFHDLGKPKAVITKQFERQHEFTLEIIDKISNELNIQKEIIFKIKTIVNSDPIGKYLNSKHNMSIEMTFNTIETMADELSISIREMWLNLLVYFQCDASGYNSLANKVFITDSNNRLVFSASNNRFLLKDTSEINKFEILEKLIFSK